MIFIRLIYLLLNKKRVFACIVSIEMTILKG